MAALTKDRPTPWRDGKDFIHPVAADAVVHAGALVVLDADDYADAGSTATGLRAVGVAQEAVDNTGGADGAVSIHVRTGVFGFFANGAGDPDRGDIGGTAYIVDDQTVAGDDGTGTRSAAGVIEDVDDTYVWVQVG